MFRRRSSAKRRQDFSSGPSSLRYEPLGRRGGPAHPLGSPQEWDWIHPSYHSLVESAAASMSYQTFTGKSVEAAKRAMREALGPDAVVLATRRLRDGSVEMRGIRRGEPLFDGEGGVSKGLFGRGSQQRRGDQPEAPSLGGLPEPRVADETRANPAQALRGDFSRKLAGDQSRQDPLFQSWERKLGRHGVTPQFLERMVTAAHERGSRGDEAQLLSAAFSQTLRFAPLNITRDVPIMLIGQTGAGKTSSAAKIAAGAAAQGSCLAFISADVGRAGAIEQMQTYAEALDTRFWAVEEPREVVDIVRRERPAEGLILDTPGVSPFAAADVHALRAFREALGAEMILVIPASGDVSEHADWVGAFAEVGVRRCIITKFDASRRVGAAISACHEAGMALAAFSEAPFIADGLIDAHPDYLARRLLMDGPARLASPR